MTHEEAVSTLASERYLLEEMSEPERETFEEHYFSCVECADDVRAGGVMRDGVRGGLMNEQAVHTVHDMTTSAAWRRKNVQPRRWYQSPAIPWAAAAVQLAAEFQNGDAVAQHADAVEPSRVLEPAAQAHRGRDAVTRQCWPVLGVWIETGECRCAH